MLKAELQRVKLQLAAVHGQTAALDNTLATSLAFGDQPNTGAAAQAAQVRSCCLLGHPPPTRGTHSKQHQQLDTGWTLFAVFKMTAQRVSVNQC